ncbi:UNVERIFIED_CONTAM: hypothetical protein FKN15_069006 [Acipenser sinensis]
MAVHVCCGELLKACLAWLMRLSFLVHKVNDFCVTRGSSHSGAAAGNKPLDAQRHPAIPLTLSPLLFNTNTAIAMHSPSLKQPPTLEHNYRTNEISTGLETQINEQIIIRSRLDQSMEESQELKKELLRYKQESRNLQGVKDALQQRMAQQESSILQLRQELLRAGMGQDELHHQNVDLQRKVEERNRLLGDYKKELAQKDRLLQQQQSKLDEALRKLGEATHHKVDLQREVEHKDSLINELMTRQLDEADDLQLVRDALRSLRNSFSGHDPQHHTIDTLEQGIGSLMERLHMGEPHRRPGGKSPGHRAAAQTERDSWPHSSKMLHSHSSPALSSSASTKVLYFTDRSLTPFMVNIPKRLGEVTLRDFKAAVEREGSYRYHFKALDPEFGTVKEEVFHDGDVVPGWEGKIVAWVEEDHGDSR